MLHKYSYQTISPLTLNQYAICCTRLLHTTVPQERTLYNVLISLVFRIFFAYFAKYEGSGGLMDKVFISQPWDRGFEPQMRHDHDSSYNTSTGWFQEADSRVISIICENLLQNQAKMNKFKLKDITQIPICMPVSIFFITSIRIR